MVTIGLAGTKVTCFRRGAYRRKKSQRGFTLVELLITIVVLAVLLTVAAPSFTEMLANNRMRSEVYALRGLLTEARSEALTERSLVAVCASSDGSTCTGNWNEGYIAFFDDNGDGDVDAGDRIVLSRTIEAPTITIGFSNAADYALYNSRGNAQNNATAYNGTFTLCDESGEKRAAGLVVSPVGSVSAAVDTDDDDIPNDPNNNGGDNLACD